MTHNLANNVFPVLYKATESEDGLFGIPGGFQ